MRYLIALPLLSLAAPLAAQSHDHSAMDHSQHQMPASPEPVAQPEAPVMDHGVMDHGAMDHSQIDHGAMDHGAMDHSQMDHGASEAGATDHSAMGHAMPADPPASGPPPRALEGPRHAADTIYGPLAMAAARDQMVDSMGGEDVIASLIIERLEARLGDHDAWLWDVQGFIGGDVDRFVVKSEGEGDLETGDVEDAEVQALWRHAIGPYIDLDAGVRLDIEPETRGHAVIGLQGLAPYMIHFDAAAFLSDRGDLTARIEAEHDLKLTQSLILQPRVEFDLAAQDIPERGVGAGLSSIEAGLRLRYEIVREFAPYVGVEWERKLGQTADYARADGEDPGGISLLLGVRAWF